MKFLIQIYIVSVVCIILMSLHCVLRPTMNELVKPKTKLTASDGFVDEFEEEVDFTKQSGPSLSLRHRNI